MVFVKAVPAPQPRNELVQRVAWAYAAVLVVLTLGQLYAFEKFIPLIEGYELPGGEGTATLVAALIVIAQIFALPFLLRMPLSPLMRLCSMTLSVMAPLMWLVLSGIGLMLGGIENAGILGAKVTVALPLQIVLAVALASFAAVSTWGLFRRHKK